MPLCRAGHVKHDPNTQICRWEIGKIPKDVTPQLEGSAYTCCCLAMRQHPPHCPVPLFFVSTVLAAVNVTPDTIPDEKPTILAEFHVKSFSASNLKVDGLAIRGTKYKPFKGVRYVTQHGRYQIRT